VLIDHEFRNTGWSPVCFDVEARPFTELQYSAESLGDPYVRLVSIIINGVEVFRAITPFGGRIAQRVTIPEALGAAPALARTSRVCGVVTTYVGGWRLRAESLNEVRPALLPVPVFTLETVSESRRVLEATLTSRVPVRKMYLYATGHYVEEGATGRLFTIAVDGRVVFSKRLNWGWTPGCGYIAPIEIPYTGDAQSIRLECNECRSYWKASLALATPVIGPPKPPTARILGLAALITAIITAFTKKR
jgi:hypothetical protein